MIFLGILGLLITLMSATFGIDVKIKQISIIQYVYQNIAHRDEVIFSTRVLEIQLRAARKDDVTFKGF